MFKYCPNCKNELVHHDNSIHCDKCGFDYYFNPSVGVGLILVNSKNQIFLGIRTKNPGKDMLDMPGGFIEFHESAEDALRREMKEELNLDLKEIKYFASFSNDYKYNGTQYYPLDLFFISYTDKDFIDITNAKDKELKKGEFFDIDKVSLDKLCFVSQRKVLEKYIKEHKN